MTCARCNRSTTVAVRAIFYVAMLAIAGMAASVAKAAPLPSIDSILNNIDKAFASITDISGIVDVEQVQSDGSVIKAQAKVEALMAGVLRMTFYKPDTFADSIFVFDKNENRAIQYSPITEQAIIQRIDQVLTDRSIFKSVDQLFSLPSPDDYNLNVVGTEVKNNVANVIVSAQSRNAGDDMRYQFWINQKTWLVSQLRITDKSGKLIMTISLGSVKTNQRLKDATLKKMPPGTQYINR